jgi:hypothetical protein
LPWQEPSEPNKCQLQSKYLPKEQKDRFIESVAKGKGFMPALGHIFDPEELEQLWIYISQHQ